MSLLLDKGMQHRVYEGNSDLFVRKEQRKSNKCSPREVKQALDFVKERFGKLCPHTKIVSDAENYVIIQSKINGKKLSESSIEDLSKKTLESLIEFLQICEGILVKDNIDFDILGFQGEEPDSVDRNPWRKYDDKFLVSKNSICRKYYVAYNTFLYLTYRIQNFVNSLSTSIFQSSNLMVDDNQELFLVDNVYVPNPGGDKIFHSISILRKLEHYIWIKYNQMRIKKELKKLPD